MPGEVVLTIDGTDYDFRDGSVTYLNILHQYTKRHLPVVMMGIEMETKLIQRS